MTNGLICATFNLTNFLFAFLLALTGMLFVVVCVMSLMLYTRRKADVKRLEKYVYTRETRTKTFDCANNAENKAVKNTAKNPTKNPTKNTDNNEQKKLRHGKKNKRNATKNEDGR